MPDRIVKFILAGDSKSAVRAMSETESASKKTGRQLDKTGKDAKHSFGLVDRAAHKTHSTFRMLASATGIGGVVFGVRDAIKAGMDWQQQQGQLQNALHNTKNAASSLEQVNKAIDQSATHGGFKPAEEAQGIAAFVRETHSATEALKLNKLAVNIARGAHVDYGTAVGMVQRLQVGQTGRLQKMLGPIQAVNYYTKSLTAAQKKQNPELAKHAQLMDKQATGALAIAKATQVFSHSTAEYSHRTAGAVGNAQHSFEMLSQKIGAMLLPYATKAAQALSKVASAVIKAWPQISKTVKEVVDWMKKHKDIVIAVASGLGVLVVGIKLVTTAVKIWQWYQTLLNATLLANPIILVVAGIAALTAGVIYCYMHFKTFRNIVDSVFKFISKHWKLLATIILWPVAPIILVITHLKQVLSLAKKIIGLPGKAIKGVSHFLSNISPFHSGGVVKQLHSGGVVRPLAFAPGGMVPGFGTLDTVHARLTPGEGVLRREAMHALGAQRFAALNAGNPTAALGGDIGTIVLHHETKIGERVIAEAVTHYQLKRGARL